MIVHQKGPLEPGQLVLRQVQPQEMAVDTLCRQHRHLCPALAVELLLGGDEAPGQTGVVQLVQDALHRDVAGQVPKLRRSAPLLPQVPQHTVEQHVEIGPVHRRPGPEIPLREEAAVVVQRLPVGGQGQRHPAAGLEVQAAQRHIQIGQIQIQFIPGRLQNLQSDGRQVLGRHGAPPSLL